MKNFSTTIWIACICLALAAKSHAQPLTINTLAGGKQGTADGDGVAARFNLPTGVATDSAGNVFVSDTANGTIRKIAPDQTVSTLAGSVENFGALDGFGTNAQFFSPQGIVADNSGFLYVADAANAVIRKISGSGEVNTLAGLAGEFNSFDGTGTNANFFQPQALALDADGNIFVADTFNHTIRKITADGVVSTLAGLAGNPGGADGAGSRARFNRPSGIAVNSQGEIFVADLLNHTIRRIAPDGTVRTVAGLAGVWGDADGTNNDARFFQPQGIVADQSGNLFVADSGNQTIRKLSPSGTNWIVATVAGAPGIAGQTDGAGSAARFSFPAGLARDIEGNLYIADAGNHRIRTDRAVAKFLLNTSVNPPNSGAIARSPEQFDYGLAAEVSVSAVANPGFTFVGWSGDVLATTNTLELVMTNSKTFIANFICNADLILDNPDASYSGIWTIATGASDKFGSYYEYAATTSMPGNESRARYTPTIPMAGQYDVSIWYPQGTNRSLGAPVSVVSSDGDFQTNINQTIGGGAWNLIAPSRNFDQGTNGFLEIANNTDEMNRVVVADAVRFTYRTAPVIFVQPQEQSARINSSVTFSVLAAGTEPLNYQWRFNDVDIPGATGSSYTRTNLQETDSGGYSVILSNRIDVISSDVAPLWIIPATRFGSFSVLSDGRFHFTMSGEPGANYLIEASTNLIDWVVLTNFSSPDGLLEFTDTQPNLEKRFYRARSSP